MTTLIRNSERYKFPHIFNGVLLHRSPQSESRLSFMMSKGKVHFNDCSYYIDYRNLPDCFYPQENTCFKMLVENEHTRKPNQLSAPWFIQLNCQFKLVGWEGLAFRCRVERLTFLDYGVIAFCGSRENWIKNYRNSQEI